MSELEVVPTGDFEPDFRVIVDAIRSNLDPDNDPWDLIYTKKESYILGRNNYERASKYREWEASQQ